MKFGAKFIFWLIGWKVDPTPPEGIRKCVIAVGPHTSNWDFILGRLAFYQYGVKGRYLMKKELFWGPLGWFLTAIGGIPVDRSKKNNLTDTAVKYFEENESIWSFHPKEQEVTIQIGRKDFIMLLKKQTCPFMWLISILLPKQVVFIVWYGLQEMPKPIFKKSKIF